MSTLNAESFFRALYSHSDYVPSYEQQERTRSYAIGTDHQYETMGKDLSTIKQIHVKDAEEIRKEFNRRFNAIVLKHTALWHNDKTPLRERNRFYYAYRYRKYFGELVKLMEIFPDVGNRILYRSIVDSWTRYRELCAYYTGMTPADYWRPHDLEGYRKKDDEYHWHFWPKLGTLRS